MEITQTSPHSSGSCMRSTTAAWPPGRVQMKPRSFPDFRRSSTIACEPDSSKDGWRRTLRLAGTRSHRRRNAAGSRSFIDMRLGAVWRRQYGIVFGINQRHHGDDGLIEILTCRSCVALHFNSSAIGTGNNQFAWNLLWLRKVFLQFWNSLLAIM